MNNKHSIKNPISSTKNEFFLSIQARMCIFFALLFAIMLIIVGLSVMYGIPFTPFKGEYRQHKSVALQNLSLVANLKKGRLQLWMKERRGDAEALSESGELRSYATELITAIQKYNASGIKRDSLWTNVQKEKSYRYLVQRMNLIKDIYGAYNRIKIADASTGLIIASTHNGELGTDITNQDFFHNALQPGVREIIDIDSDPLTDEIYLYISRAINFKDDEQKKIAVLIMHINPDDFIRPMLNTGGGLGKTGEVLLVNQDARILTSLKYPLADGSAAKPLEYKMTDKPAILAAHGEQGMTISEDYRGVPVLAAYRHLRITSELGLGLVVKTDKAEALAAIKNDKISFIIIGLTCVLLVVGLVTLIAKRISRPIRRLIQTVQQVEKGNLNIRSSVTTSDEIGILSKMFDSMIQHVQNYNKDLEDQVHARTLELDESNKKLLEDIKERKRVEKELEKNILEMMALNDLLQLVSIDITLDQVVQAGLEGIMSHVSPDLALLFTREGDDLLLQGYQSSDPKFRHEETPVHRLGECLCGLAAKDGKSIFSIDIHNDPRCTWEECKKAGIYSFAALPLKIGNKIIGVVGLASGKGKRDFSKQANFLETLTNGVAIGLQNALLYEEVRRNEAELIRTNKELQTKITERKKMQEELIKMQKLESVGVLAGGIAHDFNNNLQSILSCLALAKMCTNPGDEVYEKLTNAEKITLQGKGLSQQLLTFSRGGDPIRKTIFISELIKDSANLALSGSNVRCELDIPNDLWPVEADKGQLGQVISNLIINADQAMPEGGIVKVKSENINVDKNDLLSLKEGKYVRTTIEDQGTGISHEHLQNIFDPYFTTKEKGNGLGLATCYSIIKKHDGYIDVESEVGIGTVFHIYLPASLIEPQKKPVLSKTGKVSLEPDEGKGKVLLMDDEGIIRLAITQHLRNLKYEVEAARDGAEAIELYKKALGTGKSFDAVVMDLTIPGDMGGKEATKRLLEIDPKSKVIVASGYVNDPIMAEFKKHGFKGVLTKPYEVDELDELLQKVIMEKQT